MEFSFRQRYVGKIVDEGFAVGEAPLTIPSPNMSHQTDYTVFKCNAEQKGDKIVAKLRHKAFMLKHGLNWKKELNIPQNRIDKIQI